MLNGGKTTLVLYVTDLLCDVNLLQRQFEVLDGHTLGVELALHLSQTILYAASLRLRQRSAALAAAAAHRPAEVGDLGLQPV